MESPTACRAACRRAFTLLELLIVIIIIGVLASVAMPMLNKNIERARTTEALTALGVIRKVMDECYLMRNATNYSGCDYRVLMDDPFSQPGTHFTMGMLSTPAGGGYSVVASRNTYELADNSSSGGNLSVTCDGVTTSFPGIGFVSLCRTAAGSLSITGEGIYQGMQW
jgi:prepilin-type N-terminal cleavage/methylation domain-containing protein